MSKATPQNSSQAVSKGRNSYRKMLYKVTVTAVFTALALVCKLLLSFTLPLFGTGIRIGLTGIFTFFPAILCGPVYGGLSSALCDFIGCLIKPEGAYIPWLTVTAFAGGFIKGLLWMLLSSKPSKKLRTAMLIFFIVIAVVGTAFHISLNNDGIITGIVTSQDELPSRGQLENSKELSPLSKMIVSLAKYNNDTYTLNGTANEEEIVVPISLTVDGYKRNITKIGSGAFSGASDLKKITISSKVTSIADDSFSGLDIQNITIAAPKDSTAAKFAQTNGFKYQECEEPALTLEYKNADNSDGITLNYELDGYKIKNSDAYRKNLAIYINTAALWAEITALIGFVYIIFDYILSHLSEKKNADESTPSANNRFVLNTALIKIVFCAVISGIIVTTINTEILKLFIPAYSSRTFLILWIPRLIEELIVCIIQSFAIAVLFNVYKRTIENQLAKNLK